MNRNQNNHFSIVLSNRVDKKSFIKKLIANEFHGKLVDLAQLNGVVFSDIAINGVIEREDRYDRATISAPDNRKLATFSAGERRKEFFRYCVAQNPDFMVLDNPFNHLDNASRTDLIKSIEEISSSVLIIQLANREDEILPFIERTVTIKDNSFAFEDIKPIQKVQFKPWSPSIPEPYRRVELSSETLVRFDSVSVNYGDKKVVNSVSWTVKTGEFWQLTGPNGAGKSTLLSLITGDNPKGYGQELYIFGRKKGSGESVWDIRKRIGYFSCFMTELFGRHHTLEQMILSGFFDSIGLYERPSDPQRKIADQWLALANLSELRNVPFIDLSIGLQRVALIVRAVIKHPPLLILDEPLEGLDDENSSLVKNLINVLTTKMRITTIYVSHRVEQDISPDCIFELIPTEMGSIGRVTVRENHQ